MIPITKILPIVIPITKILLRLLKEKHVVGEGANEFIL